MSTEDEAGGADGRLVGRCTRCQKPMTKVQRAYDRARMCRECWGKCMRCGEPVTLKWFNDESARSGRRVRSEPICANCRDAERAEALGVDIREARAIREFATRRHSVRARKLPAGGLTCVRCGEGYVSPPRAAKGKRKCIACEKACLKCGKNRDGNNPSYCKMCAREQVRESRDRLAGQRRLQKKRATGLPLRMPMLDAPPLPRVVREMDVPAESVEHFMHSMDWPEGEE